MAVTYRIKTERPSLDDVFWFEPKDITCRMATTEYVLTGLFNDTNGFAGYTVNPSITWKELETRKNELRPDLREDMMYCSNIDTAISPLYNPFELINISDFYFETLEDFANAYSEKFTNSDSAIDRSNLWILLYTEANNTIVEEVLVDGVKIDYATRFG